MTKNSLWIAGTEPATVRWLKWDLIAWLLEMPASLLKGSYNLLMFPKVFQGGRGRNHRHQSVATSPGENPDRGLHLILMSCANEMWWYDLLLIIRILSYHPAQMSVVNKPQADLFKKILIYRYWQVASRKLGFTFLRSEPKFLKRDGH